MTQSELNRLKSKLFFEGINKTKEHDNLHDNFLLFAANSLRNIHHKYFDLIKGTENVKKPSSISAVHHKMKFSLLKYKVKFVYENYTQSNSFRRALKIGLVVLNKEDQ